MNIAIFALRAGWDVLFFTSHRRKDLVATKVARLGRSSCRLFGEAGQNVSLVQKLGCGTVMTLISMVPGSHSSNISVSDRKPLSLMLQYY